jgi:hypothetical protein
LVEQPAVDPCSFRGSTAVETSGEFREACPESIGFGTVTLSEACRKERRCNSKRQERAETEVVLVMKVLPLVGTELRSAVIGMVAGNAWIQKQKGCRSVRLRIVHSDRQKMYLEHKRDILQNLFSGWEIPIHAFNNSGYPGVRLETRDHPKLRAIYRWFYKNGEREFSWKVLRYLTPIGIAIWYMDDGSLSFKRRDGKIHGREIHLNTYCSLEEAQTIQDYFRTVWGISWTIVANKGWFRLRMGAQEAQKFFKIIEPYVIPDMRYKVDLNYQDRPAQPEAPDTRPCNPGG